MEQSKKNIIVLGGSRCVGMVLLEAITSQIQNFNKVYIMNRGTPYWDNILLSIIKANSDVFELKSDPVKYDRDRLVKNKKKDNYYAFAIA